MEVHWIHFTEIDSTSIWAKEHASEFDPKKLTCVTADVQTAGRGRYERPWISKKGNLHMSLFLAISPDPNLAQILALSAAQVVAEKGVSVQIKWPNDLVVNQKKLCGSIAETTSHGMVLGIGMNVNTDIETDQPTISLKEITQKKWDIKDLAKSITFRFLENWKKGFQALQNQIEELLAYKRKSISCMVRKEKIQGILLGITQEGHLQVQLPDGKVRTIISGEIQRLRARNS